MGITLLVCPLVTVPCVLAASAALIDAISWFMAASCSLIVSVAALLAIVTSPNALVMMVRSSSSSPLSVRVCALAITPDSSFLPAGPEVMYSWYASLK